MRVARALLLLCLADLTASAQLPDTGRVEKLLSRFPQLGTEAEPLDPFIHNPFVRLEMQDQEEERAWTRALVRLASRELSRSTADRELASARARERAADIEVGRAEASVRMAQANLERAHQATRVEGADTAVQAALQALLKAQAFLAKAIAERERAAGEVSAAIRSAETAEDDLLEAAGQEKVAREARSAKLTPELRERPSTLGMLVQRGTILVRFRDDVPVEKIADVLRFYDLEVTSGMAELSLFVVRLGPPPRDVETETEHVVRLNRIVEELSKDTDVVFSASHQVQLASIGPARKGTTTFKGPCWKWYTANQDGRDSADLINLAEAWTYFDANRTGAATVPVAVLDMNFDAHKDLKIVDLCTGDPGAHGTQVAGLLHGSSGNGKVTSGGGAVAVVSTCGVSATISNLASRGLAFSAIIDSLRDEFLVKKGHRIVNVSLGYKWRQDAGLIAAGNKTIENIVESQGGTVRDLLARYPDDVLVISAAGNDCADVSCTDNGLWTSPINWARVAPAGHAKAAAKNQSQNVAVIEAVDAMGGLTQNSNRSNLASPGDNLITCHNGSYSTDKGSSLAAPLVSGVAALMLALNPALKPARVVELLEDHATNTNVLDADRAVRAAQRDIKRIAADLTGDGIIDWADFVVFRRELKNVPAAGLVVPQRLDLNGDAQVSRTATWLVKGFDREMTDLEVMQAFWEDPNVPASDLPALLDQ